jgi:hypothetical protein
MKKVINPKRNSVTTVLIDNCNSENFYGFTFGAGDEKGFIQQDNYKSGYFYPRCMRALTIGNKYSQYCGDSLQECIKILLRNGFTVWEFTDQNEFLQWLKK